MNHPQAPIPHPTLTLLRHGEGYVALARHRGGGAPITVDWSRLETGEGAVCDGAPPALLHAAIDQALARARYPGPDGLYAGRAHAVLVGDAGRDPSAALTRALALAEDL